MKHGPLLGGIALAATGLVALVWHAMSGKKTPPTQAQGAGGAAPAPPAPPAPDAPKPPTSSTPTLRERILATARALGPAVDWSSDKWTEIMGGRRRKGGGKDGKGDAFRYYSDGYGTTCGVTVAYILEQAGAPPDYINRDTPSGNGFNIGKWIADLYSAAEKRGTIRKDKEALALQPGDVYSSWVTKPDGSDGSHVGIVLAVDGEKVTTFDGGQRDAQGRQTAKVVNRKLVGKTLSNLDTGSVAELRWRIDWDGEALTS